jgi:hypothetical protein
MLYADSAKINRGRPWFLALLAERSVMIAPDAGLEALDEAIESVKNARLAAAVYRICSWKLQRNVSELRQCRRFQRPVCHVRHASSGWRVRAGK